jgi:hypothetical protein
MTALKLVKIQSPCTHVVEQFLVEQKRRPETLLHHFGGCTYLGWGPRTKEECLKNLSDEIIHGLLI